MRTIKYRYVFKKGSFSPLFQVVSLEDIEHGVLEKIPGWDIVSRDQYTGLKDKNGIDIYEGDIVKHYKLGDFDKENPIIGEVVMGAGLLNVGNWPISKEPEVIGNIYENPELLERTDEKLRT